MWRTEALYKKYNVQPVHYWPARGPEQLNAIAEPVSYGTNFGYPPEPAVGLSRQGELEHSALQTNAADPPAVSHIRLDTSGGPC
jgi:hypothetical protein